jgi:hypothetical protein
VLACGAGLELPPSSDLDTALDERHYLQHSIGVAGMLALQPLQTTSDRDAWHRHLLKSRGSAAGR